MSIVEHNDVDISKLFNWGRVFEVVNPLTKTVDAFVYMRLLGDADSNRARVYALRKSAELRRKLNDPNSDESVVLIKSIDEVTTEDLKNLVAAFSLSQLRIEAYKKVVVKKPVQPKSNASLAKMEKYQKEVDDYPKLFAKELEKILKKDVDALLKELNDLPKEELYNRYKRTLVDDFCEREAINAYNDMEVYLGCYKDDEYKERFFSDLEQYLNLDSDVKAEFRAAFSSIQVDPAELKKLRKATL